MVAHAIEDAKLKELYSKAANNIAAAKERYGRFESNIGLLEERMAEVSKNRALSTKAKMEALEKLVNVVQQFGEMETAMKTAEIQSFDYQQKQMEDDVKNQAYQDAQGQEFISKILGGLQNPPQDQQTGVSQNVA
jgi:predicted nuclease with TOPRIM domain